MGRWCDTQRRNENLLPDRRKKLEAIEFRFETNKVELEWEKKYQLVLAYYRHYGNSEINSTYKTLNGYEEIKKEEYQNMSEEQKEKVVNLGRWCITQREKRYDPEDERRKKLEAIEFRFVTKEDNILKKKELCFEYGIDYDKYKILDKISYQELYAKIMYLVDNNYPLEDNGKLHEIFMMSNENMVLKYMISKEELIMNYYINNKGRGM